MQILPDLKVLFKLFLHIKANAGSFHTAQSFSYFVNGSRKRNSEKSFPSLTVAVARRNNDMSFFKHDRNKFLTGKSFGDG